MYHVWIQEAKLQMKRKATSIQTLTLVLMNQQVSPWLMVWTVNKRNKKSMTLCTIIDDVDTRGIGSNVVEEQDEPGQMNNVVNKIEARELDPQVMQLNLTG